MKFLKFTCLSIIALTPCTASAVDYNPPVLHADTRIARDDYDNILAAATRLYQQRNYDEALELCITASKIKPKDFRPHLLAGSIYYAQRKLKLASESYQKAIELKPDRKELYLLKAGADSFRNMKPLALQSIRKAIEIDPKYAEAYEMLGSELTYPNETRKEAIEAYRTAIKLKPTLLNVYGHLGDLLFDTGDQKGAEEVLRAGMELDPEKTAGRFVLGRIMIKQGRFKEARDLWNGRKSDVDRTIPAFITLLERAEKLKAASDALAAKPNDPEAILQMGNAVLEGDFWSYDGRHLKAIEHFKKALELRPGYAAAQYSLVKAYIQLSYSYKEHNKDVDEGLIKLKTLDPKLAIELEEYRKTYKGALTGFSTVDPDQ